MLEETALHRDAVRLEPMVKFSDLFDCRQLEATMEVVWPLCFVFAYIFDHNVKTSVIQNASFFITRRDRAVEMLFEERNCRENIL